MDLALIGGILPGVGALAIVVALILTAQHSHQTLEPSTAMRPAAEFGAA
jgi:hypothetical protein